MPDDDRCSVQLPCCEADTRNKFRRCKSGYRLLMRKDGNVCRNCDEELTRMAADVAASKLSCAASGRTNAQPKRRRGLEATQAQLERTQAAKKAQQQQLKRARTAQADAAAQAIEAQGELADARVFLAAQQVLREAGDEHVLLNICEAIVSGRLPVRSVLWQMIGQTGDSIVVQSACGLRFRDALRDYYLAIRAAHSGAGALEVARGPMGKKRASKDIGTHDAARINQYVPSERTMLRWLRLVRSCRHLLTPPPPHAVAGYVSQNEYEVTTAGVDEEQLADFAVARAELCASKSCPTGGNALPRSRLCDADCVTQYYARTRSGEDTELDLASAWYTGLGQVQFFVVVYDPIREACWVGGGGCVAHLSSLPDVQDLQVQNALAHAGQQVDINLQVCLLD